MFMQEFLHAFQKPNTRYVSEPYSPGPLVVKVFLIEAGREKKIMTVFRKGA